MHTRKWKRALQLQLAAEIQQDVSERKKERQQRRCCQEGRMDGEKRECDEMMNYLAAGMQWCVTSCSEATPPPYGGEESCRHTELLVTISPTLVM